METNHRRLLTNCFCTFPFFFNLGLHSNKSLSSSLYRATMLLMTVSFFLTIRKSGRIDLSDYWPLSLYRVHVYIYMTHFRSIIRNPALEGRNAENSLEWAESSRWKIVFPLSRWIAGRVDRYNRRGWVLSILY